MLGLFKIDDLTEMNADSNMESLIIDPGNRDIVEAICHAQSHPWKIDNVSSKGEGQVALLHGKDPNRLSTGYGAKNERSTRCWKDIYGW